MSVHTKNSSNLKNADVEPSVAAKRPLTGNVGSQEVSEGEVPAKAPRVDAQGEASGSGMASGMTSGVSCGMTSGLGNAEASNGGMEMLESLGNMSVEDDAGEESSSDESDDLMLEVDNILPGITGVTHLKGLTWEHLMRRHYLSAEGRLAVARYMSLVQEIDVTSMSDLFYEMPVEELMEVLPATASLRKLVFRANDDEELCELNDVIANNKHLVELGDVPVGALMRFLNLASGKHLALTKLSVDFTTDFLFNEGLAARFFARLVSLCPNITDLSIGSRNENFNMNAESMVHLGRLQLERFKAVSVHFGGARLASILKPCLKSIFIQSSVYMNIGLEDVAAICRKLHEFTYIFNGALPPTTNGSNYAIDIARNNPDLKVFKWMYTSDYTTCDANAMVAIGRLQGLKELAFGCFEPANEGRSFDRHFFAILKDRNLTSLNARMYHLNQKYLDEIAANCKELKTLNLIMHDDEDDESEDDEAEDGALEITGLCKSLTKMEEFQFDSHKSLTEAGVRALVDILPQLEFLYLHLPVSSPKPDHGSVLRTGFQLLKCYSDDKVYCAEYVRRTQFQEEYHDIFD